MINGRPGWRRALHKAPTASGNKQGAAAAAAAAAADDDDDDDDDDANEDILFEWY